MLESVYLSESLIFRKVVVNAVMLAVLSRDLSFTSFAPDYLSRLQSVRTESSMITHHRSSATDNQPHTFGNYDVNICSICSIQHCVLIDGNIDWPDVTRSTLNQ